MEEIYGCYQNSKIDIKLDFNPENEGEIMLEWKEIKGYDDKKDYKW